jgi:uncharacterized protein (DUF58 family)
MLPREWLKQIRQMEVKTRLLSQQLLSGEHGSIFTGRGIDFDDVRPYQPGDDVRRIDWNVTARMRTPYVKRYLEEREITFIIMVDLSASGQFSTQGKSKIELAAELAGTLAFSAIKSNDRIALLAFSDEVEKFIPPAKGPDHVMHMLRTILYLKPRSPRTSIHNALRYLNKLMPRPVMVFLISDFQSDNFQRALTMTNQRHSVGAFVISDPAEATLPDAGWAVLQDPETGDMVEVNTSRPAVRQAFAKVAAEQREQLERMLRRSGVRYMDIRTSEPYAARLAHFLSSELTRKIV